MEAARARHGGHRSRPANDGPDAVRVKPGDTLTGIAHKHGATMKGVYGANPQFDPHRQDGIPHFDRSPHGGWDPDYLRPGDRIRLHPPRRASHTARHAKPASNAPATPSDKHHHGTSLPPAAPTVPGGGTPPQNTPPTGPEGPGSVRQGSPGKPDTGTPPNMQPPAQNPASPPAAPAGPGNVTAPPTPVLYHRGQLPKIGGGVEAYGKGRSGFGGEVYGKVYVPFGDVGVNVKVKATPTKTQLKLMPAGPAAGQPAGDVKAAGPAGEAVKAAELAPVGEAKAAEPAAAAPAGEVKAAVPAGEAKAAAPAAEPAGEAKAAAPAAEPAGDVKAAGPAAEPAGDVKAAGPAAEPAGDVKAAGPADDATPAKSGLLDHLKSVLQSDKTTVDVGLVVLGGQLEFGVSREKSSGKPASWFAYTTKKDPENPLLDHAKIKFGKIDPVSVGKAVIHGTRESLAKPAADAGVSRLSPLHSKVGDATKSIEVTISAEQQRVHAGPLSGYTTETAKITLGDYAKELQSMPAFAPPSTRLTGLGVGVVGSWMGVAGADELIGKDIGNRDVRLAVDRFAGAMTGAYADVWAQRVLGPVVSKATASVVSATAPVVSKVTAPVASAAAPIVAKAAPVVEKVGEIAGKVGAIASKIPGSAVTGRILMNAGRMAGPGGAVLAGIPDGIAAAKAFGDGDTAEGWRSVGRASVRVGATAVGAAVGQAFLPFLPGVGMALGAVGGAWVGDHLASLF